MTVPGRNGPRRTLDSDEPPYNPQSRPRDAPDLTAEPCIGSLQDALRSPLRTLQLAGDGVLAGPEDAPTSGEGGDGDPPLSVPSPIPMQIEAAGGGQAQGQGGPPGAGQPLHAHPPLPQPLAQPELDGERGQDGVPAVDQGSLREPGEGPMEVSVPQGAEGEGKEEGEGDPEGEEPITRTWASPDDPSTILHRWRIVGFSRITERKLYSDPPFEAGGYLWRVLIFAKGNQMSMEQASLDQLSLYLDVANAERLPNSWSRYARFTLSVVNQKDKNRSVRKDTNHGFNARDRDWGFTQFMPLSEVYDPSSGFVVDDTLVVEVAVNTSQRQSYAGDSGGLLLGYNYDSKKETGMVGLKNQGATCYMNSLLQTLYHIPYFRKAVYHMPTGEASEQGAVGAGVGPTGAAALPIPLALQGLFWKLQHSDSSVGTKELTKSFGWDTYDSFMQHDVQELNRVLCEKLEDKMKGTTVDGSIQLLFEGHMLNYIQCLHVDYKSARKESFYDLQLDVKGCKGVYESFDKYCEVERLEGDNKYHAEQFGLQEAEKGVLFIDFPPVLQLQLKRFEYDFVRDTMVKINDRYEFPERLDLDVGAGKYLVKPGQFGDEEKEEAEGKGKEGAKDAMEEDERGDAAAAGGKGKKRLTFDRKRRNVRNLYSLHSVLVHSGGVHGGHYYAFIRPDLKGQWFKFDDERVTKEEPKKAIDDQFGGEEELPRANLAPGVHPAPPPLRFTRYSNAYMLVYIRDCDAPSILCPVHESDIAQPLQVRLKKEAEEKERKRKEKAEAHLVTVIRIVRDDDIRDHIGRTGFFELVDWEAEPQQGRTFRVPKGTKFSVFKEEVEKQLGIPAAHQRYWSWAKRENGTFRPSGPLSAEEESTYTVARLKEQYSKAPSGDLKLFLEGVPAVPPAPPVPLPSLHKDSGLVFFKLYDPYTEQLRYVGRLFVDRLSKPTEYLEQLRRMAGFSPNEDILLSEEIKFEPLFISPVDLNLSFKAAEIGNGDIICYQRAGPVLSPESDAQQMVGEARSARENGAVAAEDGSRMDTDVDAAAAVADAPGGESTGTGTARVVRRVPPRFPDAVSFLTYIRNRQVVHFRRLEQPKEDAFTLELSKRHTYDDVVEQVARKVSAMNRMKKRTRKADEGEQGRKFVREVADAGAAAGEETVAAAAGADRANGAREGPKEGAAEEEEEDGPHSSRRPLEDADADTITDADSDTEIDPSRIRLTAHNSFTNSPKPPAFKYRGVGSLSDMLINFKEMSDTLYYEVLDIPLPELQRLKTLSVAFHDSRNQQVAVHSVRLPREATVSSLIKEIRSKVQGHLSNPQAELRVLHVFCHRILKVFPESEPIENINEQYWQLRVEEVPEEERGLSLRGRGADVRTPAHALAYAGAGAGVGVGGGAAPLAMPLPCLVCCYHVSRTGEPPSTPPLRGAADGTPQEDQEEEKGGAGGRDTQQPILLPPPPSTPLQGQAQGGQHSPIFGDPFVVPLRVVDTVGDMRQRIRAKLQVPDEEFATWRLGLIAHSGGGSQFLDDPKLPLAPFFQGKPGQGAPPNDLCLALEHTDTNPRRPAPPAPNTALHNRYSFEKPVRILN